MATKTTGLKTHGELVGEQLLDDDFRQDWERLSLARAVAARLIGYRAEEGITQSELASRLGLRQPNVARLEAAGHVPNYETLARISGLLGVEFTISITPADKGPRQLTRSAREHVVATYRSRSATVRLAAT